MSNKKIRWIATAIVAVALCTVFIVSARSDNDVDSVKHTESSSTENVNIEEFPVEIVRNWEYYKKEAEKNIKEEDVIALAKVTYGEARGVPSTMEKAAVMWCVLNRADINKCSIAKMASNRGVFYGYSKKNPVTDELRSLAKDVLTRYYMEKMGVENVGRVLPPTYLFFNGKGGRNHFREKFRSRTYWNWSLKNPYSS